ncbi:IS630 transposase-related protein [Rickettsia endosymbiont of Pantilius tunicatus]|uniref:IS630 transposase-related protein n=1 Tax=Rickettsia endosymbiont of Pantilius tunicatus TaxID=3066267 RepID=UPI00376EDAFC
MAANTVRNWYKRYKSEGHYLARRIGGKKGRVTSQDVELYVSSNPNFTLLEMGTYFNMSSVGAYYWLKQLGFSYKKKTFPTWKQVKKSEISTKRS